MAVEREDNDNVLGEDYKGGLTDRVLRSLIDTLLVIPTWPIFATLAAYVTIGCMVAFGLLIAVFSWPGAARAIRSQVLSLREREFVRELKSHKRRRPPSETPQVAPF